MPDLLFNLLLTWLLETPVYALFLRKKIPFVLLFSLMINGFTLPVATWVYQHKEVNWYLLELAVVSAEFFLLRLFWKKSWWYLLLTAFTANLVSAFALPLLDYLGISF
jgi:hypothetical protein